MAQWKNIPTTCPISSRSTYKTLHTGQIIAVQAHHLRPQWKKSKLSCDVTVSEMLCFTCLYGSTATGVFNSLLLATCFKVGQYLWPLNTLWVDKRPKYTGKMQSFKQRQKNKMSPSCLPTPQKTVTEKMFPRPVKNLKGEMDQLVRHPR